VPSERKLEWKEKWKNRSAITSFLREDTPQEVWKEAEELARTPPPRIPPDSGKTIVHLPGDYATEELLLADVEYAVRKARRGATGSEEPPMKGGEVSPRGPITSLWDSRLAMDATARQLEKRTGIPYEDLYRWMHTGERPSVPACRVEAQHTQCDPDPDGEPFTLLTLRLTRPPTARELESIRKAIREALGPKGRLTPEQRLLRREVDSNLSEEERRGYERDPWERVGRRMVECGAKRKGYRGWAEQYRRAQRALRKNGNKTASPKRQPSPPE